jgi:twitching motility protein PilJ
MTTPPLQFSGDRPMASQKSLSKKTSSDWRFNSIGSRLFLYVLGGALVGLGAMAYLFYQTLERQSEVELEKTLNAKVNAVDKQLVLAVNAMDSLSASVKTLHENKVKDRKAYNQLAFEFFFKRPSLAMAAGFGQAPNALVPELKGFWPYFYLDQKAPDQIGKRMAGTYGDFFEADLYTDDVADKKTYFDRDYYKIPASGQSSWVEPYRWYGLTLTTYANPIYDSKGRLLAATGIDLNLSKIAEQVQEAVFRNSGHFIILSDRGTLIAYPPDAKKATELANYQTIPELKNVWSRIQQNKQGLLRVEGKFWAYERIPTTNWLVLAVVPESEILGPVLAITVAGSLGVGLLLALVVCFFVWQINRRLKPILNECNKLAETDALNETTRKKYDEIGQLSFSFFNLLERLAQKEENVRQEANLRLQLQEEQRQTIEAESQVLQEDIGQLLEVVASVEEGDLTVQAPVNDRVTGLVSDTFNRLVEQVAQIMVVVSSTAQQVTQKAETLEQLSVQTAQQLQQQTQSVESAQALMLQINALTQDNNQQTQIANESVRQAQNALVKGQQQMTQLNIGIGSLQRGTEQINKRVQTLTDFVQLAVQFAREQKRIVSMTRVLSLNASLLSARASEQQDPEQFASIAREFETVAAQVNDLAVQTSQSLLLLQQRTNQIQTVVSGLSQDTGEINQIVRDFTSGVGQSRQVFEEIDTATMQVAQVGQQVTQSSMAIASAAQTTLQSIGEIAVLASNTEDNGAANPRSL